MITDYLPTYHQVEPNNLKGLQPGFVVAQMGVASATADQLVDANGMMENGLICGISADGIVPAGSETKVLFLHFTEPLNTLFKGEKFFAVNTKEEHPRLVQLIPGDEWMSDMEPSKVCIDERIVVISSEVGQYEQDDFYACSELADGTEAYHYMYIG
jgi:hypothetical protein